MERKTLSAGMKESLKILISLHAGTPPTMPSSPFSMEAMKTVFILVSSARQKLTRALLRLSSDSIISSACPSVAHCCRTACTHLSTWATIPAGVPKNPGLCRSCCNAAALRTAKLGGGRGCGGGGACLRQIGHLLWPALQLRRQHPTCNTCRHGSWNDAPCRCAPCRCAPCRCAPCPCAP